MLVDAPRSALDADPYSAESLDLTDPGPETHKLLTIQRFQVWEDGTVDDINVRTVQSNEWCELVGAREGAEVPLPLDLVDMGLPEGLTGTVLSIQQCPQPPPGPGRLVLTTVNHLNRGVIELDLRGTDGKLETLRPTGNHKFYSVTRNAWLSAAELVEGEQLDGVGGLVTVERKRKLPGTHRVYNLTVQGEHLYRVATSGVLVHNDGCGGLGKYTVGSYNELRKGAASGLDAHHVGQKALMARLVKNYNPKTAPSILVPNIGHTRKGDLLNVVSRNTSGITSARDLLARDIRELRRVYPDIPNSALRELIELNKRMFPELLK